MRIYFFIPRCHEKELIAVFKLPTRNARAPGELKREIPLGHFFLFSEQVIVTGFNSDPVVHIFGWLLAEGSTDKRSACEQTVRYTFKFDSSPIMGLGLVNSKQ